MVKLLKRLKARDCVMASAAVFFILIQVWMDLKLSEYMGRITLLVQTPGSGMNTVLHAGGSMLLFIRENQPSAHVLFP